MPLVTTQLLVDEAARAGFGVGAFNVISLEHAEAIAAGAEIAGARAILQISENAVTFHGGDVFPLAAACQAIARASSAALSVHLDHVTDDALFDQAADAGFSSVMYDASQRDYADNVVRTRLAVQRAHARGLWVESELGTVGGKDGAHAPGVRTDPDEAAAYVEATGVDALAVAVGSSHAMTERSAVLDDALIAQLRTAVPVPLVLHGSSGVAADGLRSAIAAGMVKINIGTALNIAYTGAVRERLGVDEKLVDPRRYLTAARDAMAEVVASTMKILGAP